MSLKIEPDRLIFDRLRSSKSTLWYIDRHPASVFERLTSRVMKVGKLFALLILVLGFTLLALADEYKAKPGETILRLAVEGRGDISIKLFTKEAPKTTKRIIDLTRNGFYDGQKFFRVVTTPRPYIAQIGDPQTKNKDLDSPDIGNGGTGTRIPYEDSKVSNSLYSVGLATLPKDRDSGDCQFYINLAPNKFLDGSYTVFGQVVGGTDVVKKLQRGDKVTKATIIEG